jgi:hypothetical protein
LETLKTLLLGVFLVLIAWQLYSIRSELRSNEVSTTLFLNIISAEKTPPGVPITSIRLQKKHKSSLAIGPGMELTIQGEASPMLVVRVLFEGNARGVHLKPKRVPLAQLERAASNYIESGWQNLT